MKLSSFSGKCLIFLLLDEIPPIPVDHLPMDHVEPPKLFLEMMCPKKRCFLTHLATESLAQLSLNFLHCLPRPRQTDELIPLFRRESRIVRYTTSGSLMVSRTATSKEASCIAGSYSPVAPPGLSRVSTNNLAFRNISLARTSLARGLFCPCPRGAAPIGAPALGPGPKPCVVAWTRMKLLCGRAGLRALASAVAK